MKKIALTIAMATLLAACSSTPTAPIKDPNADQNNNTAGMTTNNGEIKTVDTTATSGKSIYPELTDPRNVLSQRRVYFDYDSFIVRPNFNEMVQSHAKFLLSHREVKIILQGNTDNRGTAEYNLALGQKRAEAVSAMLKALGVPEGQIEAVSFGEERPLESGDTDETWARNRRADMVYPGEQSN